MNMKIKRLDIPKLPTSFQFGMNGEFLSIDFCTDSELPPSDDQKTSFSTVILTKNTADKVHKAIGHFLKNLDKDE